MSVPFQDTFDTFQTSGTTIPYDGTWTPISTRQLSAINGTPTIASPTLNLTNGVSTSGFNITLTYNISPAANFSNIGAFAFQNVTVLNSNGDPMSIQIFNNGNLVGTGSILTAGSYNFAVSPLSAASTDLTFNFTLPAGALSPEFRVDQISSLAVCVAHDSEILSSSGQRVKIQDLQRGDEIQGGRVAQVIRNQLSPLGIVEAVVLEKDSLGPNLPEKRIILCADHYLVYAGKRRLARSLIAFPGVKFVRGRVDSVLPRAEDGNYYFYDIQYDHEGEYVVNGLTSQSRSPYASVSPLPLELYYEKENYKEVRVGNTSKEEPEISYMYLLPSGEEVESLVLLRPSSSRE
ncbi:Hypothetical protein BRZCDTV_405 [Brazilian cedratvirus IHUMI]|uniref:Hedgehog/Intein (Hint) domain-containing protein n=1 Tax=Brazilian cedratvirus IHUMI TaxID=2126980 RepID=A0A2R8FF06_9VIRU|nr:Hypothetical protein BRZCDTV_405 [Brazilian cedratvirus IHUMI]